MIVFTRDWINRETFKVHKSGNVLIICDTLNLLCNVHDKNSLYATYHEQQ